jgi:YVTN family beta-propeller protein
VVSNDSKTLYVAARDSNEIAVINTEKLIITKRIAVGKHPFGLSLTGDTIYSVNVYDNTVSAINTLTFAQTTIKVGEHPYCAVASLDNKTLYVSNTQDDTVSVIDLSTNKTIVTIDVGMTPEGISIDHARKRVFIANWGDNNVSVIDANTNKLITNIKTGDKSRAFGDFILSEQK